MPPRSQRVLTARRIPSNPEIESGVTRIAESPNLTREREAGRTARSRDGKTGCSCTLPACTTTPSEPADEPQAQKRLPVDARQQPLDAIYPANRSGR